MIVSEALRLGVQSLGHAREVRLLMAAALKIEAGRLILHEDVALDEAIGAMFWAYIQRRLDGAPISQIIGRRQFWGRDFKVTQDVLDPRPETEGIVAEALTGSFSNVLDLGTGSGAILISLLMERPSANGVGVDASEVALEVARCNSQAFDIEQRCSFKHSDWFHEVSGFFDLIVSNPPYIPAKELDALDAGVTSFEPHMALTDGGDGLSAYRAIFAGAATHLTPVGRIIVEFGAGQGPDVAAIALASGWKDSEFRKDLDGRDRILVAQNRH